MADPLAGENVQGSPGAAGLTGLVADVGAVGGGATGKRVYVVGLGLIFVAALAVRLWFNFVAVHPNNFAACDAYEYISNGRALLDLQKLPGGVWAQFAQCLAGQADQATWTQVRSVLESLRDFGISGPVFPLFIAVTLLLTGSADLPIYMSWDRLIAVQSVLSAVTCVFIAAIGARAFSRRVGLLAGVLAVFYPGFIVNSGRLYSESFACFLLGAVVLLTVRGFRATGNSFVETFVSGVAAALLQLTRSTMVALSLALIPLTFFQQRKMRRFLSVAILLAAFATVCLPWLGFQKLLFGKGSVVVDRVGHYNFFVGNNSDIGGWLSYPYPDGRGVEDKGYPQLLQEQVRKSPERWLKLMMDKPARLFKFPWNDFRTAIGPFTFAWQVAYQQFLLFAAAVGVALCLACGVFNEPDRRQLRARLFIGGLLAFHCVYFAFITVPRYNLTAMPELILFAAAGLATLTKLVVTRTSRTIGLSAIGGLLTLALVLWVDLPSLFMTCLPLTAKSAGVMTSVCRLAVLLAGAVLFYLSCRYLEGKKAVAQAIVCLMTLLAVPLLSLPLRANGRWSEWSVPLSVSGGPVKQVIQVPFSDLESVGDRRFFLLLDLSRVIQPADGLSVRVNGQRLAGPVVPGMALVEGFDRLVDVSKGSCQREGERMWDQLTGSVACSNVDLRQWSLVELPASLLASSALTSLREGKAQLVLDVDVANLSDEQVSIFGNHENGSQCIIPSVSTYSWEKSFYGVENPAGLTDTRYDMKVPAANVEWKRGDLSRAPGYQSGSFNVRLLCAAPSDQAFGTSSALEVPISVAYPLSMESQGFYETTVKAPQPRSANSLWLLRLKGRIRRTAGDACASVSLTSIYEDAARQLHAYSSPWAPKAIRCSSMWRDFEVAVPVQPATGKGKVGSVRLGLAACRGDVGFNNVFAPSSGSIEFEDLKLEVLDLPANPVGLGHRVF